MVETITYAKRIDFTPFDETIDNVMDGLKAIFNKHPGTLSGLHIDVDQFDDGATARVRLLLKENNDTDDGDNAFLDEAERTTFLVTKQPDDETMETPWIEPPFEYCIRCGAVTKLAPYEAITRLKLVSSGKSLKCANCGSTTIDYIE